MRVGDGIPSGDSGLGDGAEDDGVVAGVHRYADALGGLAAHKVDGQVRPFSGGARRQYGCRYTEDSGKNIRIQY